VSAGNLTVAGFDFNPDVDLKIGPNGAWEWARSRPDRELCDELLYQQSRG